jgi:Uma2 family endonuclease
VATLQAFDHDELVLVFGGALRQFVRKQKLGRVAGGGSFQTAFGQVHVPSVSFISNNDLQGEDTSKCVNKAPTLAVEIISQNDTYYEVEDKVDEFLQSGSKAVWIISPRQKTVTVRTPDDQAKTYKMGQSVPGGEVLPGFELAIADIFEE